MAAFQKLGDYTNGTVNDGSEVTTEFNNIYEAFSGVSFDKEMERKLSHATKAPMIMNQTGEGKQAQFQLSGTDKVTIENNGQIKSLIAIGTAPIDVVSTTKCPNLNADLLDDKTAADFAQLAVNVVTLTKSWLYPVLPAGVESTESQPRFIVPSGGTCKITKIYCVWAAGSDSGASNIFTIKRRNAAGALQSDVGTIEVNTPAQNAVGENDIGDVTCTAKDQIYPLFTTRNTASEQMVTISIEITQTLN